MALPDLKKYDLLDLILAETWPEEKQADTALKFNYALAGYLNENLSPHLDEKTEAEFEALTRDPSITPQKIEEFYKTKIPDFWEKIEQLVLEFKKMFVLGVYENKVKELKDSVLGMEQTIAQETDEARKTLYQKIKSDLADWEEILNTAKVDDWDRVYSLLQAIPH